MMLLPDSSIPLRNNAGMASTAKGFSVPPSVGGLNARDELANMDERDALILDNLFAEPTYLTIRRGHVEHATGLPEADVKTIMSWEGPSSRKMFAATNGAIYDVTDAGAVGSADVSSLNANDWQFINFATSGGNFLLAVNGSDDPLNYSGSAWSTSPAITASGLTASNLINITAHKERVWLIEKNTLNAWYLPSSSIGGTAVKYPLGSVFKLGGSLKAVGTMSQDAGDGADDFLCFLTDRGELAIYQGTDPSSANTWGIVGRYRVGVPIGNRCMLDVGGDLAITTTDGILSVVKMMQLDRSASENASITNKIQNLFSAAVRDYSSLFGWQGITYPRGNWALFNIPQSGTRSQQYVMNTITGAWCRFLDFNAICWGLLGDDIYFGKGDGVIYKADTGYSDNGGPITASLQTAWNYFKSRGQNKFFTMARPIIGTNGTPSVFMEMNVDFQDVDPTSSLEISGSDTGQWGSLVWGEWVWSGDSTYTDLWQSPGVIGYCGSMRMSIQVEGQTFVLNSFDVQALVGGPI